MPAADLYEVFTSLQGEGSYVGRRQIFIRFAGCNLDCHYCDTKYALKKPPKARFESFPFSNTFYAERNPVPAFRLKEYLNLYFTLDPSIHSVSLTGGEPLLQDEFIYFFLSSYKENRIYHLETNGTLPEKLKNVIDLIDFLSIDVKISYLHDELFLKKQMDFLSIAAVKPLQIKIVITKKESVELFQKAITMIKSISQDFLVILQPDKNDPPPISHLITLQKEATFFLRNTIILPQIHTFLGIK